MSTRTDAIPIWEATKNLKWFVVTVLVYASNCIWRKIVYRKHFLTRLS